eukprot:m.118545 g.118545  ORF g.118545 m.118545 type:complete len:518 (-) comp28674_c0_seq2:1148-2701(-)
MPKSKKKTRREHTPTTPAPTSAVIGAHFPPSEDLVDSTYVAPPIRFLPISDPGDQASIYAFIQDCVQDPFFNPLLPRFEIDQPLPKRPTLGSLCERVEPYLNRLFPAEPRTDRELFHAYIAPTAASLVKKVRAVRVFDLYLLALQVGIDVFAHSSPTSTSPTMEPDVQPDPTTPAPTTIPAPVPPTDASNHPQQPSHNLQLEAQLLQANDKLVALRARVTAAHLREAQVETERLTAQLSDAASMSDLNSRLKGTADQPVVAPTNQQKRQQTADDKDVEREALLAKIDELSRRLEAAETRTPQMQNAVDVYGTSNQTTHRQQLGFKEPDPIDIFTHTHLGVADQRFSRSDNDKVNETIASRYADSTNRSLPSKIKKFVMFCHTQRLLTIDPITRTTSLPPIDGHLLCFYVVWASNNNITTYDSIYQYVSALRGYCRDRALPDPCSDVDGSPHHLYYACMRGLKRRLVRDDTKRTPITRHMLSLLVEAALSGLVDGVDSHLGINVASFSIHVLPFSSRW